MLRGILGKILLVVYVVVGLIVANSHHYFAHLDGIKAIASAGLAVLLWPLRSVKANSRTTRGPIPTRAWIKT